jgi:hypothetical protein
MTTTTRRRKAPTAAEAALTDPWPGDLPPSFGALGADALLEAAACHRDGDRAAVEAFLAVTLPVARDRAIRDALSEAEDAVQAATQRLQDLRDDVSDDPSDLSTAMVAAEELVNAERTAEAAARLLGRQGGVVTGRLPDLLDGMTGRRIVRARRAQLPKAPDLSYRGCRLAHEVMAYTARMEALGMPVDLPMAEWHLQRAADAFQGILDSARICQERIDSDSKRIDRAAHQAHLDRFARIIETGTDPGTQGLPEIPPLRVAVLAKTEAGTPYQTATPNAPGRTFGAA